MKKYLALIAIGLACLTAPAQVINTNTSPPSLTFGHAIQGVFDALTTGTNWAVAPFFTVVEDTKSDKTLYGGGLAVFYNLGEHSSAMLRVEGLDKNFYLTSAALQLQLPFDLLGGKMRATPFGFVGGAYKLGSDSDEGMIGIAGAGWDFKIPSFSNHYSFAFDAEYWSDRDGIQWRISPIVWRF
jgi:opacity protein-like surface antigen